jgi:long-chain acyl-CoA synthetase
MSKRLMSYGIEAGDRVVLLYENSLEFYIAYFAIWQIGAVVVPLNVFLHEKELAYIINDSEPKLIIASATQKQKLDLLILSKMVSSLPPVLSKDDFDWACDVPENIDESFVVVERNIDELSVLLYTSGTTGAPKGVMLSSRNVMANLLQGFARFTMIGLNKDDRFFCVLPLFHVFAQNTCLWLPTIIGASVIVVSQIDRKLILGGLQQKPTIFLGVPALYGLLCMMRNAPLDSVKLFVNGADMLPDKIRAAFGIIYGRKICAGYGLTESAPLVAVNHENNQRATVVVGYPLCALDCDVRDDANTSVAPNIIGTLWLKGDNIMMGYYKASEATARVLVDGWLNTGDLAYIDKQGRLAVCGRTKDIIIHKGFNIYPAEIENVLLTHPAVYKVAVIGQEEASSGQVPVAYVALRKREATIERDLRVLCAQNLASYKVPRKFVCLDDLPMNATGKVDKKQLKQQSL